MKGKKVVRNSQHRFIYKGEIMLNQYHHLQQGGNQLSGFHESGGFQWITLTLVRLLTLPPVTLSEATK